MIIPDVNLLVYAHNDQVPEHEKALAWWEKCLNGSLPIGLSWVAISGFLCLMTHPRVLVQPMPVGDATARVREWLAQPPVMVLHPGAKFAGLYLDFLDTLEPAQI